MDGLLISSLVIALVVASCGDRRGESNQVQVASQTAAKSGGDIISIVNPELRQRTTTIETTGKIQFNEERLVRVNAPLTGRVAEVFARPGDVVEPGHRLFTIDSADLGAAKSDYIKAISDLGRAEKALALARDLFEVKAIPEREIRDAENDYRKASAEKERASSRLLGLGVSDAQLKEIGIRGDASTRIVVAAPRSGVIVERNVAPGQTVTFGQSDTPVSLFVIADLSTVWVLADIYEPDVPKVRLGQTITITPPCCPEEKVEGKITYISDSVDPQTRTVKVRALVPNTKRMLKSEMFVKVIIAAGATEVLALPQAAILRENNQTFVLVEKSQGNYERRAVKLGADLDGVAEVLAGVSPQDRVVAKGSILLKGTAR